MSQEQPVGEHPPEVTADVTVAEPVAEADAQPTDAADAGAPLEVPTTEAAGAVPAPAQPEGNIAAEAAEEDALLEALADEEGDAAPAQEGDAPAAGDEVDDLLEGVDGVPLKNPDEDFPQATWEELFGAIPRDQVLGNLAEGEEEEPLKLEDDPEVYDSRGQLLACFGDNFANELSISAGGFYHAAEVLKNEMKKAQLEQDCDDVDACFGVSCRTNLLSRPGVKLAPLAIRTSRRPKNPLRIRKDKQPQSRLLMEMPTIDPNRQILHAEPSKFLPKECRLQDSDPRNVFTPQNVMRWNYLPQSGSFLSNARFVTWSDGSTTLHVGSDVYECFDNVDAALHVVTSQRSARPEFFATKEGIAASEADSRAQMPLDVEAVPIDRHIMVRAAANMPNSIETFIQYHSNKERARELQSRVDVPVNALPDFGVAKDKRAPPNVQPSLEEQFINQYKTQYFKNNKEKLNTTSEKFSIALNAECEARNALMKAKAKGLLGEMVEQQKKQIEATKGRFGGQKRPVQLEVQTSAEGPLEDLTGYLPAGDQEEGEGGDAPTLNDEDAALAQSILDQAAITPEE